MKKKILLSFGLLLVIFLAGSIIAWAYITRTTHRMDKLIMLHQVEILREDLIIRLQQVQAHVYRSKMRNGGDVDVLISQVQEMDRVMDSCVGCHHAPELTQGLMGMRDMASDYKAAISHLVTASANPARLAALERRVQDLGQELITMTQGMAFTAMSACSRERRSHTTIRRVRNVLLILPFRASASVAFLLASLDLRLRSCSGTGGSRMENFRTGDIGDTGRNLNSARRSIR
jgi:hypothetical protein